MTVDDLYRLPDDGMRHELLDGALLVSPPPDIQHQLVVTRLVRLLSEAMPPYIEVLARPGVRLSDTRLFQPDLVIGPRDALTVGARCLDVSDVLAAIEVVSPASVSMDRVTKPALYSEVGIPVYIRIERSIPDGPGVYVHRLEAGTYRLDASAHAGHLLVLNEPFAVSFDPAVLSAR